MGILCRRGNNNNNQKRRATAEKMRVPPSRTAPTPVLARAATAKRIVGEKSAPLINNRICPICKAAPLEVTRAPQEVTRAPQEVTRAPQEVTRVPQEVTRVPQEVTAPSTVEEDPTCLGLARVPTRAPPASWARCAQDGDREKDKPYNQGTLPFLESPKPFTLVPTHQQRPKIDRSSIFSQKTFDQGPNQTLPAK